MQLIDFIERGFEFLRRLRQGILNDAQVEFELFGDARKNVVSGAIHCKMRGDDGTKECQRSQDEVNDNQDDDGRGEHQRAKLFGNQIRLREDGSRQRNAIEGDAVSQLDAEVSEWRESTSAITVQGFDVDAKFLEQAIEPDDDHRGAKDE